MKILLLAIGVAGLLGVSGCASHEHPRYSYYGSQPGYWDRGRYHYYSEYPGYHDRYYSGYYPDYRYGGAYPYPYYSR